MHDHKELLLPKIKASNLPPDQIDFYTEYVIKLASSSLPPILSFKHLADLLGISAKSLHALSFSTSIFYKSFYIPKKSGGERLIQSPYPMLDAVQRWILQNILKVGFLIENECIIGYMPGKSIVDHVKPHANSECIIKFDIKNFFPSIDVEAVTAIFSELGYVRSVARTLAALVTLNGRLPQGAATSPFISNIYMRHIDSEIGIFCKKKDFIYTRYADDIVVSGGEELKDYSRYLKSLFFGSKLSLNHAKTRIYYRKNQTRFITGLSVTNGEVRVPKAMRRRIRSEVHKLCTLFEKLSSDNFSHLDGVASNCKDIIFDPLMPVRVIGKLNYWLMIEPESKSAKDMKCRVLDRLAHG